MDIILAAAGDKAAQLSESFDAPPQGIRDKMADHMRLAHRGGPDGLNEAFLSLEASLSPNQLKTVRAWVQGLSKQQRTALIYGLGG